MDYSYVPINRIFSKVIRDTDISIIEGDIIEWCGEALEFIGASRYYEEAIAFVEINNHQCNIPAGSHNIIQIARNRCWTPQQPATDPNCVCPSTIITSPPNPFVQESNDCCGTPTSTTTPPDYIVLDCNGMPINDYDIAYYRPYFDLQYEYNLWSNCSFYASCYTPVRLKTNSFFDTVVNKDPYNPQGNPQAYDNCDNPDEYKVIRNSTLRFSFECGSVAIAYQRQVIDAETGYPLIPDNISYTTAITKYITMKVFEREFYRGRDGAEGKLKRAESDWQWYCKQASNVDMMPHGVDQYQNLLDQRSYLLPRNNRYSGFFGKMATPESRKFDDPDNRNWTGMYFRGI